MPLSNIIQQILDFLQKNQILLTALGLGGAGAIVMWVKGVPLSLYNLIKREFTTEMVVSNQNTIFYDILKLVKTMYGKKNLRKLKLSNGRYGSDETVLSMGYGTHLLKYKKTYILVTLTKESANQTSSEKDSLSFLKLGRNHKIFDEIVKDAESLKEDYNINRIYKMDDYWSYVKNQRKRGLKSIFIEQEKKDQLLKVIEDFINNEQWYLDHGIPYQLGILLYGPAGTGKTSLIKAIASYLNYSIYYLPTGRLGAIEKASATLPDKTILVIEDIDSNPLTKKDFSISDKKEESPAREGNLEPKSSETENIFRFFGASGLSEILNALDGLFSSHGRILIATTNHLERLDASLIRPGRIDIKLEIGYVNNEILKLFLDAFFVEKKHSVFDVLLRDKLTIAELQNKILSGYNENDIIEFVKEKKGIK